MKTNLLYEFEKLLNEEAKEIFYKINKLYNYESVIDKSFFNSIKKNIKREFEYYTVDIELRVLKIIFQFHGDINNSNIKKMNKLTKDYLTKYAEFCIENNNKDHVKAAEKMANILIDSYYKNSSNLEIEEIIANNMSILFNGHSDSVDLRAMLIYLQSKLEDMGYNIVSIKPFSLIKFK